MPKAPEHPNLLFIMTDDMGAWAMHCAGNSEIHTPNLDRLAAMGMRMENLFCVSPVCSPARMSVYTGQIPSQHGVHDWLAKGLLDESVLSQELREGFRMENPPFEYIWPRVSFQGDRAIHYLRGKDAFTDYLADAGYECGLSGKWHMGDSFTPQAGFTYWRTTANGGENYMFPVVLENGEMTMKRNCYVTNYIADNALRFLDIRNQEQPFCLAVHFTAPGIPPGRRNAIPRSITSCIAIAPSIPSPLRISTPGCPIAISPLPIGRRSRIPASALSMPITRPSAKPGCLTAARASAAITRRSRPWMRTWAASSTGWRPTACWTAR